MSKKKKWWQTDSYKTLSKQFPNSAKKHESGIPTEYLSEDYDYDYYQDDWGKNLDWKQGKKYTDTKKEYDNRYKKYEQTGLWGGYSSYRTPQLSYKYVQQMANAIAGQHNITLEIAGNWEVDLLKKKLRYNPASLIYGTKSELLATLLHEIGKLRYMEHYTLLQSKYLAIYKEVAAEGMVPFEDVRVDYQMLRAYDSAAELYDSALPSVNRQIATYQKFGKAFREASVEIFKHLYDSIVNVAVSDPEDQKIELLKFFGTYDISKVQQRINDIAKYYHTHGCLFDYCADILNVMYDLDNKESGFENIKIKVGATIPAIEPIKKQLTSQGTVDIMETEVFPHIEDLLKDVTEKKEQIEQMFPEMPAEVVEMLVRHFTDNMAGKLGTYNRTPNANEEGKNSIRGGSSPSSNNIPPEWLTGDYKELKDSVSAEIKSLVHKLTFLRREEMTVKYESNQKRGKLNTRKLVKHAFGSRRLFKQRIPNVDTIQSFAFSVLMDVSGSMTENYRIVHTTRAMVMFNEVFKKLNIPFELVIFDNNAKVIKSFEQDTDKKIEGKIGGLAKHNGGSTNLHFGLDALKIQQRPEHNKIVIVLTDGGVGDVTYYDATYFIPWKQKNVKSLVFGLELSEYEAQDIKRMCEGTGKVVENASALPAEFSTLVKNIIKRK